MKPVHMIWIGDLSESVQECINSFARFHEVHLWAYQEVGFVNCIPEDAETIFPRADFNEDLRTIPSITDWLRVNLIYRLGGWYSDCDNYCLRQLSFEEPDIFTRFSGSEGDLNNSIFKCAAGSPILKDLIDSYSFDPHRAGYLEFSAKCRDKDAAYFPSGILHFKIRDFPAIAPDTHVIHLFSARNETLNMKHINNIKAHVGS